MEKWTEFALMKCHGDKKKSGPKIHTLDFLRHIQTFLILFEEKVKVVEYREPRLCGLAFCKIVHSSFFFHKRYHPIPLFAKICLVAHAFLKGN